MINKLSLLKNMMINANIGIMCGRLSKQIDKQIQAFPSNSWKKEFELAHKYGFNSIEWIFDSNINPISNHQGVKEISNLSKIFNIEVNSICCDFFMQNLLFNNSENIIQKNLKILEKIIESSHELGINIIEIPLVDSSSLGSEENKIEFKKNIEKILPLIEKNEMFLALETDLKPKNFEEFLSSFDNSRVVANYDTGNSASLGYDIKEEFLFIGKFIKNIHIKDRIFRGGTVDLGTGDANFNNFFDTLSLYDYTGDLIIQGARLDDFEEPSETCLRYLKFTKQYLHKH